MGSVVGVDVGYVLIMASALVVGAVVRRATSEPLPLPRWQRLALVFGALIGGTVAAKIPWLVMDPEGLLDGTAWLSDGRTITFGLVGGYFGVEVAKLTVGVRQKTGDSFAVPLAATIAMGRLGCFWAGFCFGAACDLPWAVDFGDGIMRHPTQLYELAFHVSAAVALYQLGRRQRFTGQRIKLYFIAYFVFRFFTEWLRPEPRLLFGLTLYQLSALVFIALFVGLFVYDQRRYFGGGQPASRGAATT